MSLKAPSDNPSDIMEDILDCPRGCAAGLRRDEARQYSEFGVSLELACPRCGSRYPVLHGIPIVSSDPALILMALDPGHRNAGIRKVQEIESSTASLKSYSDRERMIDSSGMAREMPALWEYHMAETLPTSAKEYESVVSYVRKYEGPLAGKMVLNLGCGADPGFESFRALGARMVEQDIVFDVLSALGLRGAAGVCCDMRRLPFREGSFDIVIAHNSLHHVLPVDEPLGQMCRVLKPGGRLYCDESNRGSLTYRVKRMAPRLLSNFLWKVSKRGVRGSPFEGPIDVPSLVASLKTRYHCVEIEVAFSMKLGHFMGFEYLARPMLILVPSLSGAFRLRAKKPGPGTPATGEQF